MTDDAARVLAGAGLRAAFQPVVDLATGATVGHEALARGPSGTPLERPDALFAEARRRDAIVDLDTRCQLTAIDAALAAGTSPCLFVNAEPETLGRAPTSLLTAYAGAVERAQPLVVEVTERSVTAGPSELLAALVRVRAAGARIAMDDVGADLRALAFLALLRPEVIKLDLRLVQQQPSSNIARIVTAVNATVERTGAVILAEGIETEEHLASARAIGATLGQGWLFGRPEALPGVPPPPSGSAWLDGLDASPDEPAHAELRTPHQLVAAVREVRVGRKDLLIEISKHLEAEAARIGEVGVLLSSFQHARHFTPDTRRRYHELATRVAFVAALGEDLRLEPSSRVRSAELLPDDEMTGEWDVVVLGPHFAAALTALDLGDRGPEAQRRFAFTVTYDRDRVVAAARSLVTRVTADLTRTAGSVPSGPRQHGARSST